MIKLIKTLAVCLLTLAAVDGARAQITSLGPVEMISCNYTESGSFDRFQRVVADWNEWMDDQGINSYTGVTLEPYYYSSSFTYDLVWLGAMTDGAGEGELMGAVIRNGNAIKAEFAGVVDCPQHTRFYGGFLRPWPEPADGGVRQFRSCSLKENRTIGDALGALSEWIAIAEQFDTETAHAVLFPAEGEASPAGYDFKWMIGFPSAESYGAVGQRFVQSGLGNRFNQMIANIMECDTGQTHAAGVVRRAD